MGRSSPSQVAKAAQTVATLIVTVSNINWKGFKPVIDKIKELAAKVNLQDYWGRLILVTIAGALIGFVLFDWRRQAVEATEAKAAAIALAVERDTLLLKVKSDEAARMERTLILAELAKMDEEEIKQLQEALNDNPDWANQPLPAGVRDSLRP